jgi:proteasome lid subunit RPN8/RPN11
MFLNDTIKAQIREHARLFPAEEICGLIVFDGKELLTVRTANDSPDPKNHFILSPKGYLQASLKGDIVAYYHSHVTEHDKFSDFDKINFRAHKLPAILYLLPSDTFLESSDKELIPSYIGREFKMGTSDCFTVVKDYFKKELNLTINDYPRDNDWTQKSPELYEKNYENEGFRLIKNAPITLSDAKLHDVFLFQLVDVPYATHAAVYLNNGFILHHPRNKYSTIEKITDAYLRRATLLVRHEAL